MCCPREEIIQGDIAGPLVSTWEVDVEEALDFFNYNLKYIKDNMQKPFKIIILHYVYHMSEIRFMYHLLQPMSKKV